MLRYLFNHEADGNNNKVKILNYNNWFWECIENYFMGNIPIEVKSDLDRVSD